jgi:hypothetical protein
MNELVGTRNDHVAKLLTTAPAAGDVIPCTQINSGEGFNFPIGTASILAQSDGLLTNCILTTASSPRYYCLNLISLLGTLNSGNYFPLFACTSAPLRIEIQLVSSIFNAGMDIAGTYTTTLNNVEYIANFIKLSDSAMSIIYDSLQGNPLQFVVPDYANYQYTFAIANGSTTQVNFAIAAKYSSLKSIFITIRDKGTGALTFFPFSSVTAGLANYYFRIGSQIMPTKAPDNYPEMFSEVMKAMGSMSDLNYQPSIEKSSYETVLNSTASTTANNGYVNSGSFYIGLDLENYVSSNKDSIFCGYNSNTDDIFAVLNFSGTSTCTARFDAFAMFDAVIVCENSTAYRRF